MKITALLLAAGESKRLGVNKLLLDMGGETLVERVVDVLLQSQVDEVLVVAGFEAELVRQRLQGKPIRLVLNRHYQEGMASSFRVGVSHVDPAADGVLIALADHPWLTSETVDRLIDAYRGTSKGIVCPTYRGMRGHPVIFNGKRYRGPLSKLRGDIGGRRLIEGHRDDLLEVPVDSPGVIRDIDRWEDYEIAKKMTAEKAAQADEKGEC
jgi:molybdenum cofactor cytidylyltransferase